MDDFRSDMSEAVIYLKKARLTLLGKTSNEVKKNEVHVLYSVRLLFSS
ncbi:MAG: hypothetical protein PHV95_01235 [Eubacteriales bacterium]|nr:hypothetical protein [Eubacteriales bacterium]